jgi:hypothetical protein
MTRHVRPPGTVVGRAASTATTRADISINLDRDGGPTSYYDEEDHAMALAEHHGAT